MFDPVIIFTAFFVVLPQPFEMKAIFWGASRKRALILLSCALV